MMRKIIIFFFSRCLWFYVLAGILLAYYAGKPTPIGASLSALFGFRSADLIIARNLAAGQPIQPEEYWRAIQYYQRLEKLVGPRGYISGNAGYCYYRLKRYREALRAYNKALELSPQIYTYYADKAAVYFALNDYPNALAWVEKALATMPTSAQYYRTIVDYLMTQGGIPLEEEARKLHQEIARDLALLSTIKARLSTLTQDKRQDQGMSNRDRSADLIETTAKDWPLHFDALLGQVLTEVDVAILMKTLPGE